MSTKLDTKDEDGPFSSSVSREEKDRAYSLEDALTLQDACPSPLALAEEQAEAQAAVAQLEDLVETETEEEESSSSRDDNEDGKKAPAVSSSRSNSESTESGDSTMDFTVNTMSFLSSSSPAFPKVVVQTTNKTDKPALHGNLFYHSYWDGASNKMIKEIKLQGHWSWTDDVSYHFELNSSVTDSHLVLPTNEDGHRVFVPPPKAMFEGFFVAPTPDADGSIVQKNFSERNVELEFRDYSGKSMFKIQGSGSNNLGDFSLTGTARWMAASTNKNDGGYNTYEVDLRKTYYGTAKTRPPLETSDSEPEQRTVDVAVTPTSSPVGKQQQRQRQRKHDRKEEEQQPKHQQQHRQKQKRHFIQKEDKQKQREEERQRYEQLHRELGPPLPLPTTSRVDRVNGKGMWHAWTRSFDTPLLALLDLFDNAVDASWSLLPSTSTTDSHHHPPKIRVDLDTIGQKGVVLRNASTTIPSLKQVLQVYKSSKAGDEDNSIGENGIGVKHACASLSSLSLLFTKTKSNTGGIIMSMGILMQDLQRDEGIVLPSMEWKLEDIDSFEDELERLCETNPLTWGRAVREYGNFNLWEGIDHCLEHMEYLRTNADWKDSENVFCVVLTNLKHAAFKEENIIRSAAGDDPSADGENNVTISVSGRREKKSRKSKVAADNNNITTNNNNEQEEASTTVHHHDVQEGGDADEDEDAQRSSSLLKNLREKLPYLYLHLHDLDIRVEGQSIESVYWERRLAELSKFELQISQTELWREMHKLRYKRSNSRNVYDITNPSETVRFFCGFDPYRCQNARRLIGGKNTLSFIPGGGMAKGNNTTLKVFLYSRQSGRLIKVQDDPRNEFGLLAGSSDYSQGLTVIIDDYNGTLPLNPTKQDTAYGHSKHGAIHAANLKEWTAAITHFYWHYHHDRFEASKEALTQAVSNTRTRLENAYKTFCDQQDPSVYVPANALKIPPLCEGKFITYDQLNFTLTHYYGNMKIRANKCVRSETLPVIPTLQVVRLHEEAAAEVIQRSAKKRRLRLGQESHLDSTSLSSASQPIGAVVGGSSKRFRSMDDDELVRIVVEESSRISNHAPKANAEQEAKVNKMQQELRNTQAQNAQLLEAINKQQDIIGRLREKNKHLRQKNETDLKELKQYQQNAETYQRQAREVQNQLNQLRAQQRQGDLSPVFDFNDHAPDPAAAAVVERLKIEVRAYKSRAEFYKNEATAKKAQIRMLIEEKARFEDRIQELEEAQFSGKDSFRI